MARMFILSNFRLVSFFPIVEQLAWPKMSPTPVCSVNLFLSPKVFTEQLQSDLPQDPYGLISAKPWLVAAAQ